METIENSPTVSMKEKMLESAIVQDETNASEAQESEGKASEANAVGTGHEEQNEKKRKEEQGEKDEKNQKTEKEEEAKEATPDELERYLKAHYELRFNLLTEQTEYRQRGSENPEFKVLTRREENTFYIEMTKAGLKCKERALERYLHSTYVHPYHPFRLYMDSLPTWDQHDRIEDLASRVSSEPYWIGCFHRWMLALTAQWMGLDTNHANSTAPLLISEEQGWMKSTFCKSLVPPALKAYYTDQMDVSQSQQEKKLAVMGLINLDEFDRLSPRQMASLKNLMQLSALNLRKAYRQNYQQLPRIASFIGTSNRKDLLTDPTGSRRFICVEVAHAIDCTQLDLDQIYAQLKQELQDGMRYWFTHTEEATIQERNKAFYQATPEEELFRAHFRAVQSTEEGELVSLEQIIETLHFYHKGLLRNLNLNRFGSAIVASGVERIHTREGNRYRVVRTDAAA